MDDGVDDPWHGISTAENNSPHLLPLSALTFAIISASIPSHSSSLCA